MNRKADKELFKTRAEKCAKEIIDYLLKKKWWTIHLFM